MITASLSLADIPGTLRLWRQRKTEFSLSIAAFLGVALLGVLPGIGIAVGLSILNVFRRAWRPYETVLGRVPGLAGYHDVHSYPDAQPPARPGDLPVRRAAVLRQRQDVPGRGHGGWPRGPAAGWIVIAAEPITDVDTTAADMLVELDEALNAAGHQPGVRGAQGPGPAEDRPLRPRPHDRAGALLPDPGGRRRRLPQPTGADWASLDGADPVPGTVAGHGGDGDTATGRLSIPGARRAASSSRDEERAGRRP